ncbi:MAG: HAD hydrolase-like protein, partial [Anaerolineaceae bacterium]
PASACMYIGDRIARDVLGAKQAGFKLSVQIEHAFAHGETDEGAIPDAVIHSMDEVLDLLHEDAQQPDPTAVLQAGPGPCAVLFDAGDILYYRPRRHALLRPFLRRQGLDLDDLDTQARREVELEAYQGQITQDQYREAIIRCYGIMNPSLVEEGRQILKEEDNDLEFFDGVAETLHTFKKKGYLLGIVTDTAASISNKLEWFKAGGFGNVWDTIISSVEIGVRKPHPNIYRAALTQLGVLAEQAGCVGHKASELEGARNTGMITAAFNYEADAAADYYINHFSELAHLAIFQTAGQRNER